MGFQELRCVGQIQKLTVFAEIRLPNIDDHFEYSFDRTVFNILHPLSNYLESD